MQPWGRISQSEPLLESLLGIDIGDGFRDNRDTIYRKVRLLGWREERGRKTMKQRIAKGWSLLLAMLVLLSVLPWELWQRRPSSRWGAGRRVPVD